MYSIGCTVYSRRKYLGKQRFRVCAEKLQAFQTKFEFNRSLDTGSVHIIHTYTGQLSLIGLWIQAQDTLYIVEPDRSLDTGSGHILYS